VTAKRDDVDSYSDLQTQLQAALEAIELYEAMKDGFSVRASELETVIQDLSMLVRRLCFVVNRNCTDATGHKVSAQALDYLRRKSLIGSPLK
jgi:hypothetical protein